MRKLAQKKNSFPQNAEACPEKKTAFRKMRKLAQKKNSFPQNAEARPEKKQLSAICGNSPRRKPHFRNLRFCVSKKDFPQNAEAKLKM